MKYRSEIDGLRAVAVLPVVLFHAGFYAFSGGFVGVDIFFVISGYLITTILISETEAGNFSIARFYERRARRILPALFFVMIVTAAMAWLWLTPAAMTDFYQSIIAVIFFASNFLFWKESGYFAAAAELKPLLHTWSLAVEEQYYLMFPLLMMLLPRFGRTKIFLIIVGMAIASLAITEWGWRNVPSANFYLLPSRIWELLAGSICAFVLANGPIRGSNLLGFLGLGLVIFSIFAFDRTMPFPSLYTLVPIGGTVLIILFSTQGTWSGHVLSFSPLVGIGMISYSAYLWHQPLFAFARLQSAHAPSELIMAVLASASIVLAFLTWRFVEQPFRKGKAAVLPSQRSLFIGSGLAGTTLIGVAFALNYVPTRLEVTNPELFIPLQFEQTQSTDCPNFAEIGIGSVECVVFGTGDRVAVVWGDSHADALKAGIVPIGDFSIFVLSHHGCPPAVGVWRPENFGNSINCRNRDDLGKYLTYILDQSPEVVFLIGRWTMYLKGWFRHGEPQTETHFVIDDSNYSLTPENSTAALVRGLERTISQLSMIPEIFLVSQPVDLYFMSPHNRLISHTVRREDIADWHSLEDAFLTELENTSNVSILWTKSVFCTTSECLLRLEGAPLYADDNHLSSLGARMQWELIAGELENY